MAQTFKNNNNRKTEWELDRESLNAVKCGGSAREDALEDLWERHAGWLKAVARRQLLATAFSSDDPMQAEDVLQEVFLRLLRSAHAVKADYGLRPWFKMVARNVIVDCIRKGAARETSVPYGNINDQATPNNHLQPVNPGNGDQTDLEECVRQALHEFARNDPKRGNLLKWVVYEEPTSEQVAAHLGRTPGASRTYLYECRKKLKSYLEPCRDLLH